MRGSRTAVAPAIYITTAIPYVNAEPHVGFAMELVLADALARYHRLRGHEVRLLTGSDENSLKNVQAAESEGLPVDEFVAKNAQAFSDLRTPLDLSFDDFIRTSSDPRHRAGVEKLWRRCVEHGDVYRRAYRGKYCVGCEQFYADDELKDGCCPEHGTEPDLVEEENFFFKLSRYTDELRELIASGRLRVEPERYRDEILAFARDGLQDFSISRSQRRARGWGIPVPDDPDQVMYVWFDALGNYVTALDYASDGPLFARFWRASLERIHVIGKGITRFHVLYWPAMLLAAGLPLPTKIAVHGYLTVEGRKIGKSLGNAINPLAIVEQFGTDVVRFYLCSQVRFGHDGDFSAERVSTAHDAFLADQLGNLLSRTVAMVSKYYEGSVPERPAESPLSGVIVEARARMEEAFETSRIDLAFSAAWTIVEWANKHVIDRAPWKLAKDRVTNEQALSAVLYELVEALRVSAVLLSPFLPSSTAKILEQIGDLGPRTWESAVFGQLSSGTRVVVAAPLFPKISARTP
jgi:methionyl-tRNA synthetase